MHRPFVAVGGEGDAAVIEGDLQIASYLSFAYLFFLQQRQSGDDNGAALRTSRPTEPCLTLPTTGRCC